MGMNIHGLDSVLGALGLERRWPGGEHTSVTDELLTQILITMRILAASNDTGFRWDTGEAWVRPGTKATRVVPVEKGEMLVVKLHNYDLHNANTIYYGLSPYGPRPNWDGLDYHCTVPAGGYVLDFDEGGGALSASISAGEYDADGLASAVQSAMNAAGALTYTVSYDPGRYYTISATGTFSLLVSSGTHVSPGSDIFTLLGFSGADRTGGTEYTGNLQRYNEFDDDNWRDRMFPLPPGESTMLVLESDLYAMLDSDITVQVPMSIRRSRVWSRRR